jgi:hypothetical protein
LGETIFVEFHFLDLDFALVNMLDGGEPTHEYAFFFGFFFGGSLLPPPPTGWLFVSLTKSAPLMVFAITAAEIALR